MTVKSVEPQVADKMNQNMAKHKLDYKLEQGTLNTSIDNALNAYYSKRGGTGGNRPDAKLLLQHSVSGKHYPILMEYKGYEGKLEKLDENGFVENTSPKGDPLYKNINSYAVNGAVHYANGILQYTDYDEIIAIGATGYIDAIGELQIEISAYFVSKDNLGVGKKIGSYKDLSFLSKENFDDFIEKAKNSMLDAQSLEQIKRQKEIEIDIALRRLNQDIYQNEKGLGENDRVYIVSASIMATMGAEGVAPLTKEYARWRYSNAYY